MFQYILMMWCFGTFVGCQYVVLRQFYNKIPSKHSTVHEAAFYVFTHYHDHLGLSPRSLLVTMVRTISPVCPSHSMSLLKCNNRQPGKSGLFFSRVPVTQIGCLHCEYGVLSPSSFPSGSLPQVSCLLCKDLVCPFICFPSLAIRIIGVLDPPISTRSSTASSIWPLTWVGEAEPRRVLNDPQFDVCSGRVPHWKPPGQGQQATYSPHYHDGQQHLEAHDSNTVRPSCYDDICVRKYSFMQF